MNPPARFSAERSRHADNRALGRSQPVDGTATEEAPAGQAEAVAPRISVLIVDDRRLMAEGLASLLSQFPEIAVTGWVETANEALAVADAEHVDVVIIDAELATEPWSQAASAIRVHQPRTEVVVVNASETEETVVDAIAVGVGGFLGRSASVNEVATAVRRAGIESVPLPARALAAVLARRRSEMQVHSERSRLLGRLTPREREVLTLMARGFNNRAMAAELGIGYSTVRSHVRGVLEKLGTHSRLQAVALANRIKLLEEE
jgi:DNA-binding NarL/FixJ family response regulator